MKVTIITFCRVETENQEYILQECPNMGKNITKCHHESIFKDEINSMKENAELIIKVEEKLKKKKQKTI